MRTTLSIDDDILHVAKAMAAQQRRSIGEIISDLARLALHKPEPVAIRNGIPLLKVQKPGNLVTMDLVNALRDEQP